MSPVASAIRTPAGLALLTGSAAGHAATPDGPLPPLQQAWTLSAWSLAPIVAMLVLYIGARVCTRVDASRFAVTAFGCGTGALLLALVWPLDAYAAWFVSAHVAQHMALLALAPPLLLAARPFAGLVASANDTAPRFAQRCAPVGTALGAATLVHIATLWLWHLPATVELTLASASWHRAMLASTLLAGLWFWHAVLVRLRARDGGAAGALVALVTVMMTMGFLGALLTFAPRLLYAAYTDRALLAGADALHDQQLAGLLMWVPGGLPYLVVGLCLARTLLRDVQARAAT